MGFLDEQVALWAEGRALSFGMVNVHMLGRHVQINGSGPRRHLPWALMTIQY